jgi:hypothetical protein
MQKVDDAGGVEKAVRAADPGNYECPPVLRKGIQPSASSAGQKNRVPQGDFLFTPVRRRQRQELHVRRSCKARPRRSRGIRVRGTTRSGLTPCLPVSASRGLDDGKGGCQSLIRNAAGRA